MTCLTTGSLPLISAAALTWTSLSFLGVDFAALVEDESYSSPLGGSFLVRGFLDGLSF